MPSENEMAKMLVEEMNKTFNEYRKNVDKQLDEMKEKSSVDPLLKDKIEKQDEALTELRKSYDELLAKSNRPSLEKEDSKKEDLAKRQAFEKYIRVGASELNAEEKRALQNSADADGGFLVPVDFENNILMNAYDESAIRQVAGVGTTGRDTVFMPSLAKPSVAWGVTGLPVTAQDINAGGNTIQIYDLKALTLIHNNTLDDSSANIWNELSMAFSDAIAEAEDVAFATGAGDRSPQGVIADATVKSNFTLSGVSGGLTDATHNGVDALLTALYKLKATYRRNATFAFNSTVEAIVRKLKDSNGQYLWQPPVQAGRPATLLGKSVVNPEGLPDADTNGLFPIVVGDFKRGYAIRDRAGISVSRLSERYAEYDQTGFMVKKRVGGKVVLPEAFQVIKIGT